MPVVLKSPERLLTVSDRDRLIKDAGYIHELFKPSDVNPEPPFPGEALLLFAGGLVEQTVGLPEGIIALVEISTVTFGSMAIPPLTVHVELTIEDPIPTPSGTKVIWPMTWVMLSENGDLFTASIKMLGTR
jgi:hypothetical protein